MVNSCCVANCFGNARRGPRVRVFGFPKEEILHSKWIRAVHREKTFIPSKYSKVCELHFREEEIQTVSIHTNKDTGEECILHLKKARLAPGAVPSIYPNCPSYLSQRHPSLVTVSTRESVEHRKQRKEHNNIQNAIKESMSSNAHFQTQNNFSNFNEFLNCLDKKVLPPECITIKQKESVQFIYLVKNPAPKVFASAVLDLNLQLSIYVESIELKQLSTRTFPRLINNFNELTSTLQSLQSINNVSDNYSADSVLETVLNLLHEIDNNLLADDFIKQKKVQFLIHQIELLNRKPGALRYTAHFLIFSSILHSISPHSYKFLRSSGHLTLPHPRTLKRVCAKYNTNPLAEQNSNLFLSYIKQKFKLLNKKDLIVTLMVDEIHIKPFVDYSGGSIVGLAYNSENAATTAHVFMIQSLLSKLKDVVHILPVRTMNAEQLFFMIKKIVMGLQEIGFNVLCVVSDNNAINRKAMMNFSSPAQLKTVYPHPSDEKLPLFFIIDSVHIFKCVRNNWINQKDPHQTLVYPNFNNHNTESVAAFSSIKRVYELESKELVKISYGLTLKSLCPSSFERQNVKLVQNVFNEFVQQALTMLGEKHNIQHFSTTADFIYLIRTWWSIVNVKTPGKGIRFRNALLQPLTLTPGEDNFVFLESFIKWLDSWKSRNNNISTLTKETHLSITHTSRGLLEMAEYCIKNLNFAYFLPGKIQTDALEARFGKYRTMAGSQYLISMRQIFEVESKLRIQDLLPLSLSSTAYGRIDIDVKDCVSEAVACSSENSSNSYSTPPPTPPMPPSFSDLYRSFTDKDFKQAEESLPVLTYLAGYCARVVLRKLKCSLCATTITLDKILESDQSYCLIRNMDRGGLLCPHPDIVNAIIFNYITVQKLLSQKFEKEFLKNAHQRDIVIKLTIEAIIAGDFFLVDFDCCAGHSVGYILHYLIKSSTNCLLNNYVKKRNESCKKVPKKRKVYTVKKNILH